MAINRPSSQKNSAVIELYALDGDSGLRLAGASQHDNSGDSVSGLGDINGDGFSDLIIGAPGASTNGLSYVVFGKAAGFAASINLDNLNGSNGFSLRGIAAGDNAGTSVSAAGDVNGDGLNDILIGANGAAPNLPYAGASYVVFGKTSGFEPSINLSTLDGATGFRLDGVAAGDWSGFSLSEAGDVNGDGFGDLIIGAYRADTAGIGSSFVVFGQATGLSSAISLSVLNGNNGFRLDGVAKHDSSGHAVSAAGDVDGDGYDDLIIGAFRADPHGDYSGASYLILGKASGFSATTNLASLDGKNGFLLTGAKAHDQFGYSVSAAGDINGDGFADLIIGANQANSDSERDTGSSYVVFGKAAGFSAALNVHALDGKNGFRLEGAAAHDWSGWSVSGAGDVNGDGYDDLLIGAPVTDVHGTYTGSAFVVFGKASRFADTVALSSLNGNTGFRLNGTAEDDWFGWSVSGAGDVNGDGFDDLVVGASRADTHGVDSGSSYVLFGGDFNGAVSYLGSSNADKDVGTAAAERFVAGAGDDLLIGNGGADAFNAGAGDDTIVAGQHAFSLIDGGSGDDTLTLASGGSHYDLANFHGKISNIESIALTGKAGSTLTVNALNVLNLSETSNTLYVEGNEGDKVKVDNHEAWGDRGIKGDYHVYTQGQAVLKLSAGIDAFINVDETAPQLIASTPIDHADAVRIGRNIVLTFDESVMAGQGFITISNHRGTDIRRIAIDDTQQITIDGNTVIVDPTTNLLKNKLYHVKMGPGVIQDIAGNDFAGMRFADRLTFTTPDTRPPAVSISSDHPTLKIGDTAALVFTLSEDSTNFKENDIRVSGGTLTNFTGHGKLYTADFVPTPDINTTASITIAEARFTDASGNGNLAAPSLSMVLGTLEPKLISSAPRDNATIMANDNILLGFNEGVVAGTGKIIITDGVGDVRRIPINDTTQVSFSGFTALINPTSDLSNNTTYYVLMNKGVIKDAAGNAFRGIDETASLSFKTTLAELSLQPTNISITEGDGGATQFNFTVTRSGDTTSKSSVKYMVVPTMTDGVSALDFVGGAMPSGALTFLPGETTQSITVNAIGDTQGEPNENFSLKLFDATGASLTGTTATEQNGTSGGAEINIAHYMILSEGGSFTLDYDMLDVPDSADVYVNDSSTPAATTGGPISGTGTLSIPASIPLHAGDDIKIVITGATAGTAWGYTADYTGGLQPNRSLATGVILNDDEASGTGATATIIGSDADTIAGTEGNDVIDPGVGYHTINARTGDDTVLIFDASSNYSVVTLFGITHVLAGPNATPQYRGSEIWMVNVESLEFTDKTAPLDTTPAGTILGLAAADTLTGTAGDDIIDPRGGSDTIFGGTGNDVVLFFDTSNHYTITTLANVTHIAATAAAGTPYVDSEIVVSNVESLVFTDKTYALDGVVRNSGDNTYFVDSVNDLVTEQANSGIDTVISSIDYTLGPNLENLTLTGDTDIDATGNGLNNRLIGNGAANVLIGEKGNDTMKGGAGSDHFVFDTRPDIASDHDLITDFLSGADKIYLGHSIFMTLGKSGAFSENDDRFFSSAKATAGHDASDRVIYNSTTGTLYYDADGSGSSNAMQVAQIGIAVHPSLTAADITVF
ncbi:MAG: hypothetical protein EPN21_01150 [Methylococcaceae bacterium]|nr:MAG: hypothetical protein EPN21_01150 [Methylococcaceae bacterium]